MVHAMNGYILSKECYNPISSTIKHQLARHDEMQSFLFGTSVIPTVPGVLFLRSSFDVLQLAIVG